MQFICYPKCGTCRKARSWLDAHGIAYTVRDIRAENPTEAELRDFRERSGLPLRRFFNVSGLAYKALALKDKLPALSEDEQLALLAADGMLVRRPLLVTEDLALVGFKAAEWEAKLLGR